jgi:hypothetical protein
MEADNAWPIQLQQINGCLVDRTTRTGRGVLRRLDAEFPVYGASACRQRCSRARSGSAIEWQKKFRLIGREHREALERCFELGRIQQCAWHRAESAASETAMASASSSTPAIGARMIGSSTPSKVLMEVMAARAVNWCRV